MLGADWNGEGRLNGERDEWKNAVSICLCEADAGRSRKVATLVLAGLPV